MKTIQMIVERQREFFKTGKTKDISFRKEQLRKLYHAITYYEHEILDALRKDLNKSSFEGYATEVGILREEIRYMLKHVSKWSKKQRVRTPIMHAISSSYTYRDPHGVVLIMSPWNYPFQLTLIPLVGALAAGNCAVLKPSEYAFHTAEIIEKIITEIFDENLVFVARGGREKNQELLKERFDYLFFTGGPTVGKLVMEAAARDLTPVTLELGGKSPCIVDESANIPLSAKRIIWGKLLNAGQTCVAPDYILVDKKVEKQLILEMKKAIKIFYGETPENNPDYPAIINEKHLARLKGLMSDVTILAGGQVNNQTRQLAPTLLSDVMETSVVMQEEIFGPLLPIIPVNHIGESLRIVGSRPKPLALYLFTTRKENEARVVKEVSFGGGCINDIAIHLSSPYLPFGGVGESGMGQYHGKASFDTFSHQKSIMKKSNIIDVPLRYPPFKNHLRLLKKFMK